MHSIETDRQTCILEYTNTINSTSAAAQKSELDNDACIMELSHVARTYLVHHLDLETFAICYIDLHNNNKNPVYDDDIAR